MRKFLTIMTVAILAIAAAAQVTITKVDKVNPTDDMFIDMAVTAAETAVEQGKKPCGAVVILNGAWRSTGMADDNTTAEESAIARSRRTSLRSASIYTVNQPTTEALNAIARSGAEAVYFVNPAADVIAAGIYPAEAFDAAALDTTLTPVPVIQLDYPAAHKFVKK